MGFVVESPAAEPADVSDFKVQNIKADRELADRSYKPSFTNAARPSEIEVALSDEEGP